LARLGSAQFSTGVRSAIFPLVSLASHSQYAKSQLIALAQNADSGIRTWAQFKSWIDRGGHSLQDLSKVSGQATVSLSDLEKAASALNTTMQQAILSTFSQAQIKSSGLNGAIQVLDQNTRQLGNTLQGPTS